MRSRGVDPCLKPQKVTFTGTGGQNLVVFQGHYSANPCALELGPARLTAESSGLKEQLLRLTAERRMGQMCEGAGEKLPPSPGASVLATLRILVPRGAFSYTAHCRHLELKRAQPFCACSAKLGRQCRRFYAGNSSSVLGASLCTRACYRQVKPVVVIVYLLRCV